MHLRNLLPFIALLFLLSCKQKPASPTVSPLPLNDTLSYVLGVAYSADSVFDPDMRKYLAGDSTDFIAVEHDTCGEYHVEHITYIDHKVAQNIKHLGHIPYSPSRTSCDINLDSGHIVNPFPDMNGMYTQVYYYHGELMFSGGMDDTQMDYFILDSSLYMYGMTDYCWPYMGARRDDAGITTYIFPGSQDRLEIRKLSGPHELQLWRWIDDKKAVRYELRVLLAKSLSLPTWTYYNNLGLGACGGEAISGHFDKINYDSLMTAK